MQRQRQHDPLVPLLASDLNQRQRHIHTEDRHVAAALATDTTVVEQHCEQLVHHQQFLRRLGVEEWPDGTLAARYGFLHALYQQWWHERVSPTQLQQLHLHIGRRKELAYAECTHEIAAELAVHFEQGREYEKAIQYLQSAGENAVRRSAAQEAIRLLSKGLALLKPLPQTREHTHQELTLHIALGVPLITTLGLAAADVDRVYSRALVLCRQVGDTPQLFPGLWGSWVFYAVRGEVRTAQELADRLLSLAQRVNDPVLLLQAAYAQWATAFWRGELSVVQTHADQGMALYDRQQHALSFLYGGHDPGVCCRDFGALALWMCGYPDQAAQRSEEALTLAQELAHPFTLAEALGYAAWLAVWRGQAHIVHALAVELIALSQAQGFQYWAAQGSILMGWARAAQGQLEEGITQMRQGLAALRSTGSEAAQPFYHVLLAEAYRDAGQGESGLRVVTEALATVHTKGIRYSEAELYRVRGELLLAQEINRQQSTHAPNPKPQVPMEVMVEVEEGFRKALDIARQQQAKSLELRATMSLVRLRQSQSWAQRAGNKERGMKRKEQDAYTRLADAHRMLSEVHTWFTEGFDTQDLLDANALLTELA